jgi:large subunit ribosomal protein L21
MYAVILSGGKQYRVKEGQTLKLEKLDVEVGSNVDFDQILMIGNGDDIKVGKPYLQGGKVSAEVIGQGRHDKVYIIKFRRRKHHQKQMGHRQYFTEVKITGIAG